MAKAISSEELQFRKRARRRFVGAIALVLVVVVFLPMMLDNEPKPISQDIAINIPPPPADEEEGGSGASESLRFRPIGSPSDDGEPVKPDSPERPSAPPEPVAKSKPARPSTETKSASANSGFVVQLGAFSNAENASKLAAKVRDNRFDAYTEVVSTTGGKRTRVRVGPYPTRTAAEDARERLKARKLTYGEPDIVRAAD